MQPRQATIAALAAAGALAGLAAHSLAPGVRLALPWFTYPLLVAALAIAVPMLLGSVGTSGAYQAMARLWSGIGALGVVLVSAGLCAGLLAFGSPDAGQAPWLAVATGAGLLAGLAVVKLTIRRAGARRRA